MGQLRERWLIDSLKPTLRFMLWNLCGRIMEFGHMNTTQHRYRLGVFPVPRGSVDSKVFPLSDPLMLATLGHGKVAPCQTLCWFVLRGGRGKRRWFWCERPRCAPQRSVSRRSWGFGWVVASFCFAGPSHWSCAGPSPASASLDHHISRVHRSSHWIWRYVCSWLHGQLGPPETLHHALLVCRHWFGRVCSKLSRRQHLVGLLLDLDFQVPRYDVPHVMALKAGLLSSHCESLPSGLALDGTVLTQQRRLHNAKKRDLEDSKAAFLVRGDSSIADSSELLYSLDMARKCGELETAGLLCGDSSEGRAENVRRQSAANFNGRVQQCDGDGDQNNVMESKKHRTSSPFTTVTSMSAVISPSSPLPSIAAYNIRFLTLSDSSEQRAQHQRKLVNVELFVQQYTMTAILETHVTCAKAELFFCRYVEGTRRFFIHGMAACWSNTYSSSSTRHSLGKRECFQRRHRGLRWRLEFCSLRFWKAE